MTSEVRRSLATGRYREPHTRGPADGLLAEIQRDVLARHPDWLEPPRELEAAPFTIVTHSHRGMRRKAG